MDILDKLLVNFDVIASIPASGKLSVAYGECLCSDPPSPLQPIGRTWRGDDHNKVLARVENVAQTVIFISGLIMQAACWRVDDTTNREVMLENIHKIHKKLYDSIAGFDKLVNTYANDPNISAKFLDYKMYIVAHCQQLEQFLDSIGVKQTCGLVSFV